MIDWDRVTELKEEIGADSFDEVAQMFLEEADGAVAGLNSSGGAKSLEAGLHFLKGSALNLGFQRLSTLCQAGEKRAASGDHNLDLDEIRQAYAASKAAFHAGPQAAQPA